MRSEEEKPNYDTLISSIAEGIYNFRPAQNNSNIAIGEAQKGYELSGAKATAHRIAQVVLDYYLQAGLVYNPLTNKVVEIDQPLSEEYVASIGYKLAPLDAEVYDVPVKKKLVDYDAPICPGTSNCKELVQGWRLVPPSSVVVGREDLGVVLNECGRCENRQCCPTSCQYLKSRGKLNVGWQEALEG